MNRSFLIVGIPAVLTSFGWLWFVWGLKLASGVTAVQVVLIVAVVTCVLRRQNRRAAEATGDAKLKSSAEAGH